MAHLIVGRICIVRVGIGILIVLRHLLVIAPIATHDSKLMPVIVGRIHHCWVVGVLIGIILVGGIVVGDAGVLCRHVGVWAVLMSLC